MNILITGGAGFIGSHLAEKLLVEGHFVCALDDLSTGNVDNFAHLLKRYPQQYKFVEASVCNKSALETHIAAADFVYHLAAAVGVQLIVDRPVHTIETNIHGSENVLKLCARHNKKMLIASTSEVYGKSTNVPFSENDDVVLGSTAFTRWSYAASKMIDEFLALAYYEQYGLQAIICRFFNTVGPRQTGKYGMVVPRFVQKALANLPIEVYGTGQQSRCFSHVFDITEAIIKLKDCPQAFGEVINVGSTQSVTINELAEKIISLTGSKSQIVHKSYKEAYGRDFDDMMTRIPNLEKVSALIGYKPKRDLNTILRDVVEFEKPDFDFGQIEG